MGKKASKEAHVLAQWHMIGHRLLDSVPKWNVIYMHGAIFEVPMQRFIIKPPACWGEYISIEIYELLLLFNIKVNK